MLARSDLPGDLPRELSEGENSTAARTPTLAEALATADSLAPKDRVRLIARLLESLPPKHRAALAEFEQQSIRAFGDEAVNSQAAPATELIGPSLWERLFNPNETSELYSAPRRFDLATIFVVTAAYSILFGAMSTLSFYFPPVVQIAVGFLVTTVAVTQAFYKDIANPRGVSIVTGAIAQSLIVVLVKVFAPRLIPGPALVAVIFYGVLGGAFAGYLAGVLVGGVFLVADLLRKKFERRLDPEINETSVDDVD